MCKNWWKFTELTTTGMPLPGRPWWGRTLTHEHINVGPWLLTETCVSLRVRGSASWDRVFWLLHCPSYLEDPVYPVRLSFNKIHSLTALCFIQCELSPSVHRHIFPVLPSSPSPSPSQSMSSFYFFFLLLLLITSWSRCYCLHAHGCVVIHWHTHIFRFYA